MKKYLLVFAYIIILIFLQGCSILSYSNTTQSIYKSNDLQYEISGDYNGDNAKEYIYIYKEENNKSYIKYINKNFSSIQELPSNYDNYFTNVVDINKDNKDDLVLYIMDNNVEKVYIYTINNNNINLIFSSDNLIKNFYLKKNADNYTLNYDEYTQILNYKDNNPLFFIMHNVEINYNDNGPDVEVEFSIKSTNNILYSVDTVFYIDSDNKINLNEINVIPINDI